MSISVSHTHRVPPHGPSHRPHRSGVSRHLSQAFVGDCLSKLHIAQKYLQHAAGERVFSTKQRTERDGAPDSGKEHRERVPHLINQTQLTEMLRKKNQDSN